MWSTISQSRRQLSYGHQDKTSSCSTSSPSAGAVTQASVCALCKLSHHCMSTVGTWQSIQVCDTTARYGIAPQYVICRPCWDDILRIIANPSLQPRWERLIQEEVIKCCIKGCTDDCFAQSKVVTSQNSVKVLEGTSLQFDSENIPFPTPLCAHHYRIAYNAIQPHQTMCPTCRISIRKQPNSRPCPNAEKIAERLLVSLATFCLEAEYVIPAISFIY